MDKFSKSLEYIFDIEHLQDAYQEISKNSVGIDEVSFREFEANLLSNLKELQSAILTDRYTPEPLKKIEIPKPSSDELRPIGLSAIKDKIVQRVLYDALSEYFDDKFSNKSYAYRKNKSTITAINRVSEFLNQKNFFVLKSDIKDFFESINHDKLLELLHHHISDNSIIRVISLLLQNGSFKKFDYTEHIEGVHQGDILSPLLSNIYLDMMDKFLDKYDIPFVRYADDFVVLAKSSKDIETIQANLQEFLKTIDLQLSTQKTYTTHIKDGFTFLGVTFKGKNKIVDNERFQKSISHLHQLSKNKQGFKKFVDDINGYLLVLKNYYLKIIKPDTTQHTLLQQHLLDTLSHKVYLAKSNKDIKTKKEFKILLDSVSFDILFDDSKDKYIDLVIRKAYERYKSEKSYKEPISKINKQKNKYAKKFALNSTLHIATPGLALGISKNKITIKKYGKVQNSYPIDKISRIILEGKGYSLSSDVIKRCAKEYITIDFIDRDAFAYASLITYNATTSQLIHKQAMVLNTPLHITLAKEFIKGKAKNQINYLKYLDKYHKKLDKPISRMEELLKSSKKATTTNELMGYEGSISQIYWDSIRQILDAPFEKRITFGAKDIVNSSLNYGYAILYGKIQHSLVYAGLSLHISFLHSLDKNKPTLTFDMIEEFRSFIVDRTIFAMINKDEPIKLDSKGLLTKKSRKLISQNIKEKLGSYTMWKKESIKIENIIQIQCHNLAKAINEDKKYKAFIGKY